METVVLEQLVDPPMRIDDIPAMEQQAAWCLTQYRVNHVMSLLSLDGRRLVCLFAAPDAESVRNAVRQLGSPFERAWACTVHAPPSLPLTAPLAGEEPALVVVERAFAAPADFASIQAIEDRGAWCLEQHRVRFLRTYFSTDRRRMICIYAAPDAEAVRRAQTQAGVPLDRVWAARLYEPAAPSGTD